MYSTSRVTSSSSIIDTSAVACGGMVSSFVAAARRTARVSRLGQASVKSALSSLQVAIHEVDLLQPAQTLADVLRPDLPHTLDRLQISVGGGQQLVQAPELAYDLSYRQSRQPRNATQYPVAARRDRIVERVQLAVISEQLGQPSK